MKKLEPLYTIAGNVKWAATMKKSMEAPQKLKIELTYDPAISLLGINPKELT